MMNRLISYLLIAVFMAAPPIANAEFSPAAGPVVLGISGEIGRKSDEAAAQFDIEMLEALPQREIHTKTPWHDGITTFSGPRLSTLVDVVEGSGDNLRVVAINDYFAEIPLE